MKENNNPIEYFLWEKNPSHRNKLIYFDEQGNQFEKEVPENIIEEALKVFDGKRRAIRRSTGGLVIAEPFQIVLFDKKGESQQPPQQFPQQSPMLGIRIRFTDLKRQSGGVVMSNETVIHSKIVKPSDLKNAFDLIPSPDKKFLVEFGRGIVPVHLFHQVTLPDGRIIAHCVIENEWKRAVKSAIPHKITPFQISREVIRLAEADNQGNPLDYRVAYENAQWHLNIGESMVPSCLSETPLSIPEHTSAGMVDQLLRLSISSEGKEHLEPILIRIQTGKEESLLPFGIFES